MGSCATISQTDGLSHLFGACEFLRVCLSVRKDVARASLCRYLRVETATNSTIWAKTSQPSDKITRNHLIATLTQGQSPARWRFVIASRNLDQRRRQLSSLWKRSWRAEMKTGFARSVTLHRDKRGIFIFVVSG